MNQMASEIKQFRCPNCKIVTATTGHVPVCKKCKDKPMEEINGKTSN